jgi:hypothetical protein
MYWRKVDVSTIEGSLSRLKNSVVRSIYGKRASRATASVATAVELTDAGVAVDDAVFDKSILAPAVDLESIAASCGFMGTGKSYVSKPSQ